MKWCALITHLWNESGHRFQYHRCFQEAIETLDLPYEGITNKVCPIANLPKEWERTLSWRDATTLLGRVEQLFSNFFDFSRTFLRSGEERAYFLESYTLRDAAALALAISLFFKRKDRFYLLMRTDLESNYTSPKKRALYLTFFRVIQKKLKSRLILLSDSDKVAAYFEHTLQQKVHVLPIPHTAGLPVAPVCPPKERIRMWWVGVPNLVKGPDEIKELVKSHTSEKFELSLSEEFPLEGTIPIHYLKSVLTREEYTEQMANTDVILLPYDPISYAARTSGIFVETIFAGKIPFVRAGSWLADELLKHNLPELLIKWDSLDAIARLARDPSVHAKLTAMQNHYRHYHCMESFTQTLSHIYSQIG